MRLTDRWAEGDRPTISFELFPAREAKAEKRLGKALEELVGLEPDFVSVTFGAGGSTREGSRQLVARLKQEYRLEVLAYFAGYGLSPDDVCAVLDGYHDLGVENVLAVRGDRPHDDEGLTPHPDSFDHASDLLAFVSGRYNFCLGAAAHPEGHPEAESRERDLEFHQLKVQRGARYLIANYQFDNRHYLDFVQRARALGVDVPIVPGVLPIFSVGVLENMARLSGATITDELRRGLDGLPGGDKDAVVEFGIDFAFRQCRELLEAGAPGLHFYTLDRSKATVGVVERLRAEGLV